MHHELHQMTLPFFLKQNSLNIREHGRQESCSSQVVLAKKNNSADRITKTHSPRILRLILLCRLQNMETLKLKQIYLFCVGLFLVYPPTTIFGMAFTTITSNKIKFGLSDTQKCIFPCLALLCIWKQRNPFYEQHCTKGANKDKYIKGPCRQQQ